MKKTFTNLLRLYYQLAKPGIIYGNLMTAAGGFLLASRGHLHSKLLAAVLLGTGLVIASACVLNNVIDRKIDLKMARTKSRAVATGLIPVHNALAYAFVLGISGLAILAVYTNILTLSLGLAALFSYVVLYGLVKRRSIHGTLVGTIPGSASIVAGYTAVTGRLDGGVLVLFLILVFWQMAHFYSIAIFRLADYKAAKIPVLPVEKGIYFTKRAILLYIIAFIAAAISLSSFGYSSYIFGVVVAIFGLWWLSLGLLGVKTRSNHLWARQMFKFSLIVILAMSIMLSVDSMLQ